MGRGYGRELFLEFVPATVRHRSEPLGVAALSSAVIAELGDALGGPCLEVTWAGRTVMQGVLRAARHADVILAVSLPASRPGEAADRNRVEEVLRTASEAAFDRPLVLVARAARLLDLDDGGIERVAEWAFHEVEQGFTSVAFRPQDIATSRALRLATAAESLINAGIGVEIELDRSPDGGLLLAELDEGGVPLAAVRGSRPGDDVGAALVVVDPLRDAIPDDQPCRVVLDGFVLKAVAKALPAPETDTVLSEAADDVGAALVKAASFLEELDAPLRHRLEALTYASTLGAMRALGAEGTATELLDALAAELYR